LRVSSTDVIARAGERCFNFIKRFTCFQKI
jgi:hypothetical protein